MNRPVEPVILALVCVVAAGCLAPQSPPEPSEGAQRKLLAADPVGVSPDTLLLVYVHGFWGNGFLDQGVYGEETAGGGTGDNLEMMARFLGMAMGNDDPEAPHALSATDYYGAVPPDYYTEDDRADITSIDAEYGGGIPTYALIVAKFIRHRVAQSGASQVALMGFSMGGEVTRWMIEHDVEGLVSSGMINRWISISGVVQGAMTTEWIPDVLMESVVETSRLVPPELHQMGYAWLDEQYGDRGVLDNPLLQGVLTTHIRGTFATAGDYSYYPLFLGQPNDTSIAVRDMTFTTVTDPSKWVTLQGNLLGPAVNELSMTHGEVYESWPTMASIAATLVGKRRLTVSLDQVEVASTDERGPSEVFYDLQVSSPYWQGVEPAAALLQETRWTDRVVPPISAAADQVVQVRQRVFDLPLMDDETSLILSLDLWESDCAEYWDIREACGQDAPDLLLGSAVVDIPVATGTRIVSGDGFRLYFTHTLHTQW